MLALLFVFLFLALLVIVERASDLVLSTCFGSSLTFSPKDSDVSLDCEEFKRGDRRVTFLLDDLVMLRVDKIPDFSPSEHNDDDDDAKYFFEDLVLIRDGGLFLIEYVEDVEVGDFFFRVEVEVSDVVGLVTGERFRKDEEIVS